MKKTIAIVVALTLTGCATITRGTKNIIQIASNPPGATISTDLGVTCGVAPCNLEVSRKDQFIVTAELAGYEKAEVRVRAVVSGAGVGATAGNVLIGGVIGVVVDGATGATLTHKPNPVILTMQPIDPSNPNTPPPGTPETLELIEKPINKRRNTSDQTS